MLHRLLNNLFNKRDIYINLLNNSIYLNSFYLMLSSLIASATGFIFWIIVARFYSVSDVGIASAIISTIGMISVISLLGLDISLVRFLPDNKYNINELINTCFSLVALVSLIVSLTILIISNLEHFLQIPDVASIILIILALITSIQSLQNQGIFVGLRKNKYSFYQAISSLIRLGVVPILSFAGSLGIIFAYGISSSFALVFGLAIMTRINCFPHPTINKNLLHTIFHFSLGNYIARIFETLPTYLMPLIIIIILNEEASAYFYIAWQISMILLIISKSVSSSTLAEAIHNPNNIENLLRKSILWALGLLILTIVFLCFAGQYVLSMFGSNYAENAYELLIILCFGSLPFSVNTLYATVCRIRKDVLSVILIYGIIGLSTIVGSIMSLEQFGLYGGAGSWILANILALIFVAFDFIKFKRAKTINMGSVETLQSSDDS